MSRIDLERKPPARVLIVDDEVDIASVLKKGLETSGFMAVAYGSGPEALADIASHPDHFCALVSDIRMPEMTGFELARKARAINPGVKIILMTAFDVKTTEFSDVLPSTKVDDFITKPFSAEQLKQVLLNHIGETKRLNR